MKTIAFAFAGGSKYSFPVFTRKISNFIVIEIPGRGDRINQEFIKNIDSLVDDLFPILIKEIQSAQDYIIFGHSMGALIGYLMCHKLKKINIKQPLRLIVSGKKPPSLERELKLSHLPNQEFWEEVIKIGGIPDELQKHKELMEFYIPVLKADFEVIENYKYIQDGKLNLPIDVFYGSDEEITKDEMEKWKNETNDQVQIMMLEGNHFFLFSHLDYFVSYFNNFNKKLTY